MTRGRILPGKCLSESVAKVVFHIEKIEQMVLSVIVAINKNRGIGYQNKLLYWLPNDMKRFKSLTTGHTIIMGRKTFDSLPKGALPNRRNIVLTRQEMSFAGAETYHSLGEALEHCGSEEEVYVIGGASLYEEAMPIADKLCITEVDDDKAPADVFFPEINQDLWQEKSRECHPSDERHLYSYRFVDYVRR